MDLISLRYFVETVRQGSISKAAVSLGVVQPALTRRIQLLEERLGASLLLRHRRGVEPTETGLLVLERAELLLRLAHQLEAEVRSQDAEPVGQVRFGFPPSIGTLFVGKLLSACVERYPHMTLYLQEDYSPAIRHSLLAGRLDLGIMSCEAQHPDLALEPLFEEPMWVIGRPQDWPFEERALFPDALSDLPLVLGSFMHDLLQQQVQWNLRLRIIAEADSLTLAREALRAGAGFLVVPFSSLDREVSAGEFVGARLEGMKVTRGLFRHRDRPPTRAAVALRDMIHSEARHLIASRPDVFHPLSSDPLH